LTSISYAPSERLSYWFQRDDLSDFTSYVAQRLRQHCQLWQGHLGPFCPEPRGRPAHRAACLGRTSV